MEGATLSLTTEQVHFFRHSGFLKLPRPLPEERVAALKETIRQQIREEVEPVVRDRQGRAVRLSSIWERGGGVREALTCAEVLDPLEALLGPNIELITNRHNHATLRLAEAGDEYMHRDILQWSRAIVTILFYLEEATVETGCTMAVPGSHLLPGLRSLPVGQDETLWSWGILDQAVPVPMPAGGLLAIDSLILHGPGRNQTEGSRMSMTAGYHSVDELSGVENPRRVLVRGERIYMGNDR
jgi:phytanoyl-CoA hydroxylase